MKTTAFLIFALCIPSAGQLHAQATAPIFVTVWTGLTAPAVGANLTNRGQIMHQIVVVAPAAGSSVTTGVQVRAEGSYDNISFFPITRDVTLLNYANGAASAIERGNGIYPYIRLRALQASAGNPLTIYYTGGPSAVLPSDPLTTVDTITVNADGYQFSATGPAITVGANSFSLTPCPAGVAGTNAKHYLYLSGGTGTAEAVLITGGTCTSSAASGTVTFTAANTHSGAYTLTSATTGITEAAYALPITGGHVAISAGSHTLRAPIPYREHQTFAGVGGASRLVPASSSAVVFDSALITNPTAPYINVDDVVFRDLTIDAHSYPGLNTVEGIRHLTPAASTELHSIHGISVSRVNFNNAYRAIHLERSRNARITDVNLYSNSTIWLTDSTMNSAFRTVEATIQGLTQVGHCMDEDCTYPMALTAEPILRLDNCVNCSIKKSHISDLPGGLTGPDGIWIQGASEGTNIEESDLAQCRKCILLATTAFGGSTYYPSYGMIRGNRIEQPWTYGIEFTVGGSATPGAQINHWNVADNTFSNPRVEGGSPLIWVRAYNRSIDLINNKLLDLHNSPAQTGISIVGLTEDIVIHGNRCAPIADFAASTNSCVFVAAGALRPRISNTTCQSIKFCVTNDAGKSLAPAATLVLPEGPPDEFLVNGTGGPVTSMTTCDLDHLLRKVTLIAFSTWQMTDGGNLKLNGNFTGGSNRTITLICDSTDWNEVSRSVN